MKKILFFYLSLLSFSCIAMEEVKGKDLLEEYEKEVKDFESSQILGEYLAKMRPQEKQVLAKLLKNKDAEFMGMTILHIAARFGNLKLVELLVALGTDVDKMDKTLAVSATPLMAAAFEGREEIVKFLLDSGADAKIKILNGTTALDLASQGAHTEVVTLLLEHGASIHVNNLEGHPSVPLDGAIDHENYKLIKLLLKHGALPCWACDYSSMIKILLDNGEETSEIVQLLKDTETDVNKDNQKGCTPIIEAAESGYVDVIKVLFEAGLQVNNDRGTRALCAAAENGHEEVCALLLENGADPNLDAKYGQAPLSKAVSKGHIKIVELLLKNGAKIATQLDDAACGSIQNIKDILEKPLGGRMLRDLLKKTDTETENTCEYNPLNLAACNGHIDIVKLLLEHGADIRTLTELKDPDFHRLVTKGNTDLIKLLLEEGVDILALNWMGNTKLDTVLSDTEKKRGEEEQCALVEAFLKAAVSRCILLYADELQNDPSQEFVTTHLVFRKIFKLPIDVIRMIVGKEDSLMWSILCRICKRSGKRDFFANGILGKIGSEFSLKENGQIAHLITDKTITFLNNYLNINVGNYDKSLAEKASNEKVAHLLNLETLSTTLPALLEKWIFPKDQ